MLSFKAYLGEALTDVGLENQAPTVPLGDPGKTFYTDAGVVKYFKNGMLQFAAGDAVNEFTTDDIGQMLGGKAVKGFKVDINDPAGDYNPEDQTGNALIKSGKTAYIVPEHIIQKIIANIQNPNQPQQPSQVNITQQ